MRKSLCFSVILVTIAPLSLSHAAQPRIANGLGAPGFGLEVTRSFSQSIAGKLSINRFNFDHNSVVPDRDDRRARPTRAVSASLDWHPFQSGFRLSGGMLYTLAGVNASRGPTHGYTAAGEPADHSIGLGDLAANFSLGRLVPYLGIGWDHLLPTTKGLRFRFDLGITFRTSPEAPLAASGVIGADRLLPQYTDDEQHDLRDDADPHEYAPLFSIGSSYAF